MNDQLQRHDGIRWMSAVVLVAAALVNWPAVQTLAAQSAAPSNVTVALINGSVTVSWRGIPDQRVSYRVVRGLAVMAPGEDLTKPLGFGVASFIDATAVPGTTYFYRVIAVYPDRGGERVSEPIQFQAPMSAPFVNKGGNAAPLTMAPPPMAGRPRIGPISRAAPTGVLVTGTPLMARIAWNASLPVDPEATYSVWRSDDGHLSAQVAGPFRSNNLLHIEEEYPYDSEYFGYTKRLYHLDQLPNPRSTYRYTVIVYYPDGTSAEAPSVTFTSPPMVNPTGFTATLNRQTTPTLAEVLFRWNAVPGAVQYRVDGTGLPNTGLMSTSTTTTFPQIPRGPGSWRVTALYPGNFENHQNATVVSAVIRILPQPSQPWLTKPNGPGSPLLAQSPKWSGCYGGIQTPELNDVFRTTGGSCGNTENNSRPAHISNAFWLGLEDKATGNPTVGLRRWWGVPLLTWLDPPQFAAEARYGNAGDLGVGRRAACAQILSGPPAIGIRTVCYATAHGPAPGQPGFNNFATITNPAEGEGDLYKYSAYPTDFLLSMVIMKDPNGTVFLVFPKRPNDQLIPLTNLAGQVILDTQGPKNMPHVCVSCHGGTYNPITRKVDGASLLPIDPGLVVFASPQAKASEEEKIRRMNQMIATSNSSPWITAYINGLYGNAVQVPGTHANPDYVPSAWQEQAGLYRQIVRPYCALCHLATSPDNDLNFASWGNFQNNSARIHAAVCSAHTMPHSELQFKAFWLKDTGPFYLPGLLAASLGFPDC